MLWPFADGKTCSVQEGARVMLLRNLRMQQDRGPMLINGSCGIVEGFTATSVSSLLVHGASKTGGLV